LAPEEEIGGWIEGGGRVITSVLSSVDAITGAARAIRSRKVRDAFFTVAFTEEQSAVSDQPPPTRGVCHQSSP
jgi:hypothetical protein